VKGELEMIFLGIVFVALAAGVTVGVISESANNATTMTLDVFGRTLHRVSPSGVFLIGVGVACVFLLGCAITVSGVRRSTRVRRELRDLRDQQDENVQVLLAEKAQLERELERARRPRSDTLVARPADHPRAMNRPDLS
jgi:hypothetical protein